VLIAASALIGWAVVWMLSQKPVTSVQTLLHQHCYTEAAAEAERQHDELHRAEALKLLGRFDEAIAAYRRTDDPAAHEGIALSLAHAGRNLDDAKRLMEQTIAAHPQIQEFQALALAYILLRRGDRRDALRLFEDNRVLLETRFHDDYTDPDPLLAETLWLFAQLSEAAGDPTRAGQLRAQAADWAPGSVWEKSEV
jgi:tetratricopeptide (TPR) repeat protein